MENVMRKLSLVALAGLATAVIGFVSVKAAEIASGLKPGEPPAAFQVQDVTGPAAGTKLCYRCRYGGNPVVAVFTHKLDANLTNLVKKVDAEVEKNNIKNVPLTIYDGPLGPLDYKLSPKAETTVLMWVKSDVKVNHAFSDGKL